MPFEIRPITEDEIEEAEHITSYSFNSPDRTNLARAAERARLYFDLSWSLASFEDGEMTAFMRTLPFALRINGRGHSFGAVGPVVSLPQHRRKGHVGALLRQALADMRDKGQVLSGLHTPHPTLYQRYGWEIATAHRVFKFAPKDIALKAEPSERGRTRMIGADDWAQADRVYRAYGAKRNSMLHRAEVWWREGIFAASQPIKGDCAVWESGEGNIEGYLVYFQSRPDQEERTRIWVRELFALTRDAYLNLAQYLLRHDIAQEISWAAAPDDPFPSLVEDAAKLTTTEGYDLMLRICDVEGALRQRAPAGPELAASLTLGVSDPSAPWNDATWRVDLSDGEMQVEKTTAEADIELSATTLAPLFNGYLSPRAAALAGRIRARDEGVLAEADKLFATMYPPHCADGF